MYEPLICGQGLPGVAAAAGGPAKCLSLQLGALAVALQTRRVCMQKALGLLLLQKTLQQRDVQIGERQLLEGTLTLSVSVLVAFALAKLQCSVIYLAHQQLKEQGGEKREYLAVQL